MSVPSLESLLAQHVAEPDVIGCSCHASQDLEAFQLWSDWWPAHVASVIRNSRVIRSDNLDVSWPTGTVIQEIHDCGELCGDCFYPPLWEMAFQCGWSRVGKMYDPDDDQPTWPCRVLYLPADEAEVQQ